VEQARSPSRLPDVIFAEHDEIGDKEHVSTALGPIASRIPSYKVRIALVADGKDLTWDVMRRHFPTGEEILDY
jgi:hypothetical protein